MNIFDAISSTDLGVFWEEMNQDRAPYYGETKFPNKKQRGISLKWLMGASEIPIVLRPSAFDVQVIPRIRRGFEQLRAEMPFFKESYYIDEELRQEILLVNESNNAVYARTVLERVFNDVANLIESAAVSRERMRMAILTTGLLAFEGNGQAFEFDYGLDAGQRQTASVPWTTTATSDPILDLQTAVDWLEDNHGITAEEALMNRVTFRLMLQSQNIKNEIYLINAAVNATGALTDAQLRAYIVERVGLEIVVYNKRYRDESGATQKYVPDYVVTIMPAGALGNTWLGTTPEEADLLARQGHDCYIVAPGVAITTMVKEDPVSVEPKVSMICLPSFENANQIVILDVSA